VIVTVVIGVAYAWGRTVRSQIGLRGRNKGGTRVKWQWKKTEEIVNEAEWSYGAACN